MHQYDIFFLGAGKPASGSKPSALKSVSSQSRALDWQLHSLSDIPQKKIHFLGGYHIDEVINLYPELHYTVVPDWDKKSVLHTLLEAPFSATDTLVCYADTIFRPEVIQKLLNVEADIAFVYDSSWENRYENRSQADKESAELLTLDNYTPDLDLPSSSKNSCEFTGLIKFSPKAIELIAQFDVSQIGHSMIDLLRLLAAEGLTVEGLDAKGNWAEFNSPSDIAHLVLGTKAETLARLAPLVKKSTIGDQVSFTVGEWQKDAQGILQTIAKAFPETSLVVRSSAKGEDNWDHSNAGGFESVLNVKSSSESATKEAIENVISSYAKSSTPAADQVLVQEFLNAVSFSGVVFTRGLETGSPYYRINFDDKTASTESVTSGESGDLRTVLISRHHPEHVNSVEPKLAPVIAAVQELELCLGFDRLDIEFAVDQNAAVHIFQVRPITVDHGFLEGEDNEVFDSLQKSAERFQRLQAPSPFIVGGSTLFGVMPDWNPAEIIGTRPKPLAFTLYRHIITDEIWAKQRAEYGYRDVRPHPLIVSFSGQPYVDIRASLNSFIPASVSDETAEKLVNAYLAILKDNPQFHDKIEFDVAFTVWTPCFLDTASQRLKPYGVTDVEIKELEEGLKEITQKAFTRLEDDTSSIQDLIARRKKIEESPLADIDKATTLVEDCRSLGTLAFSHAARAGFVATTFLKSLVNVGIMTAEDQQAFFVTIKTVAGEFEKDAERVADGHISMEEYVDRYGHLRPGTYDITAEAYWESPARYLLPKIEAAASHESITPHFEFTPDILQKIDDVLSQFAPNLGHKDFIAYLVKATQAREYVKFEFTRNLSRALDHFIGFGRDNQISREDLSYLTFEDLKHLKNGNIDLMDLPLLLQQYKKGFCLSQLIELPQLISEESHFYCFERNTAQPNFITLKRVESPSLRLANTDLEELAGNIVLIPQADPGYDWLFAHPISGLVTQYGGANSHMAIRAAEMGLPAAIGVGDKLYDQLSSAKQLLLDCALPQLKKIA